jgi:glutaredoxin
MHLLIIVGSGRCPYTQRAVSTLAQHNISFLYVAITSDQMKYKIIEQLELVANNKKHSLPIMILLEQNSLGGYDIFKWKDAQDSASMVQEVILAKCTMKTCKDVLLKMLFITVKTPNKAIQMCTNSTSFIYCS